MLRDWLPKALPSARPWLSQSDIDAGDRWANQVARELEASNFGILCITRENVVSPWILFEAGALAKSPRIGRVVPLLLDVDFRELAGPLGQFQAKRVAREDLIEVLKAINEASGKGRISNTEVLRNFRIHWPAFSKKITGIPKIPNISEVIRHDRRGWAEIFSKFDQIQVTLQSIHSAVLPSSGKPTPASSDGSKKSPQDAKRAPVTPATPPAVRPPLGPSARQLRSVESQGFDYKKAFGSLNLEQPEVASDAAVRMLFSHKELTASSRSARVNFLIYRLDARSNGIQKAQATFVATVDRRSPVHFTLESLDSNGAIVVRKGICFASKRVLYLMGVEGPFYIALAGVNPSSRAFAGLAMSLQPPQSLPIVARVTFVRTGRRVRHTEIGRLSLAAAEIEAPTIVESLLKRNWSSVENDEQSRQTSDPALKSRYEQKVLKRKHD
jgi:hypothetical protein